MIVDGMPSDVMEATRRLSSGTAAAERGSLLWPFFRGISLHLWSANGLTAEWHDGPQGPYLRIRDEEGNTCTLHALPEQFRILYRTIGMGLGQPVDQLPTPSGAEVMC